MRSFIALLFVAAVAPVAPVAFAASAYPCHDGKDAMGNDVSCTEVKLPAGLCTACPLRPPNGAGLFKDCKDIYDTDVGSCMPAMQKYIDANPCDGARKKAMDTLKSNPNDYKAIQVVDYFLYSVCEQCCDCVPMGANKDFYDQYAAAGSLTDAARGNCPAHAFYDICKVTPNVHYFSIIGQSASAKDKALPKACGELNSWFNSDASNNWQNNPSTQLSDNLRDFLNNLLGAIQCSNKGTWGACFDLESKQNHLGVPEDNPPAVEDPEEADPVEEPPTEDPAGTGSTPPGSDGDGDSGADGDVAATGEPAPKKACFPADATVELQDGSMKTMDQLRIGDTVRVADNRFEPVYLFSHADIAARSASHLSFTTCTDSQLTLTDGHMLLVNGEMKEARYLRVGDTVEGSDGKRESVRKIMRNVAKRGLYNPHTVSGSIVVNGIVCSTFTNAVKDSAANALLAPMRSLYRAGAFTQESAGGLFKHGGEGLLF